MKRVYEYDDLQPLFCTLTADKESSEIEFKSAAGGFPRSFWETYSSFANTGGGTIIFGIKEKKDQLLFDGLSKEDAEKYQRDFFNNMHSKDNVNAPLLTEKDVQIIEHDGVYFLFFYIPRAEVSMRPIYCGKDPYSGTYRRDIEGDYHCTGQEVSSMYADANMANPADGKILKNYGIKDLDAASIKQYRRLFEQSNPDHVWNALDDSFFLEKLNVFRKDRTTGEKGLTYAGLLMFGTYSALMDSNPNFFPDYKQIDDPKARWVDRICPDGNWESNLFQFYRRVLPVLQSFLPKPFTLEGNQRKNETSAHVALREAFVNACVHADYTVNASLSIEKHPNKIVFSNPGTMLISMAQYYRGGESVCRNKYLQTMFTFLGSAEKAGSGADKILRGWEEQNWKRPSLEEKNRPDKVVLTMAMESLMDDAIQKALIERFGDSYDELTSQERLTLALAFSEEEVTNERLQCVLNIHKADITSLLQKLCKADFLESTGRGRGTRYHVKDIDNSNLSGSNSTITETNFTITGYNSTITETNSTIIGSNSNLSGANTNLSGSNSNLSGSNSNLSGANSTIISTKKRYSHDELKNLISAFAKDWKTAEEIAIAVGKTKEYIANKVLPTVMDVLEKRYDVPHHPKQKYRAKQKNRNNEE